MTSPLAGLISPLVDMAWILFSVFLRCSAIVAFLPAFGERTVPVRIKLMLSFAFTAIVAPAAPTIGVPDAFAGFSHFVWSEILIGSALGMSLRLFVIVLQTAGSIAAQSTSLAQLSGGLAEPTPAMGNMMVVAGLALAVTTGLHVKATQFILSSYAYFPAGHLPDSSTLAEWGISRISAAFRFSFSLAAPFAIAALIYNLTLGVINRAMPQLMVAFVGAPFTTLGGLVLLLFALPMILGHWNDAMDAVLTSPMGTGR